jgi:hypothetical protein
LADGGAGDDLLSVICEDLVSKGIAFGLFYTTPATGFLTTFGRKRMVFGCVEHLFIPMKVQQRRNIGLLTGSFLDGCKAAKGGRGKVVHEEDDIEKAEKPELGRGTRTIHDSIGEAFGIANLALGKVLVLLMRFALEIFDSVESKDVQNAFATLGLGIVGEKAVRSTMFADEVLKSGRHFGFAAHRVDDSLGAVFADIELGHSATGMAKDAIVMGRGVAEEGVGSDIFVPAVNVAGREARAKMFAERKPFRGTCKLGSSLDGLFNAVDRDPAEVGSHEFQIRLANRNIAVMNGDGRRRTSMGMQKRVKFNLLATLIDDEINIFIKIASVGTDIIDARVQ